MSGHDYSGRSESEGRRQARIDRIAEQSSIAPHEVRNLLATMTPEAQAKLLREPPPAKGNRG